MVAPSAGVKNWVMVAITNVTANSVGRWSSAGRYASTTSARSRLVPINTERRFQRSANTPATAPKNRLGSPKLSTNKPTITAEPVRSNTLSNRVKFTMLKAVRLSACDNHSLRKWRLGSSSRIRASSRANIGPGAYFFLFFGAVMMESIRP